MYYSSMLGLNLNYISKGATGVVIAYIKSGVSEAGIKGRYK